MKEFSFNEDVVKLDMAKYNATPMSNHMEIAR